MAPLLHSSDSYTSSREAKIIPIQELHNGGTQPSTKLSYSAITGRAEDMDTDGEIDVDDCDDGKYKLLE